MPLDAYGGRRLGTQPTSSYDGPRDLHFHITPIRPQRSFPRPRFNLTLPIFNKTAGWGSGDPTVGLRERVQVERVRLEGMANVHDEEQLAKRWAKDRIDLKRTRAFEHSSASLAHNSRPQVAHLSILYEEARRRSPQTGSKSITAFNTEKCFERFLTSETGQVRHEGK